MAKNNKGLNFIRGLANPAKTFLWYLYFPPAQTGALKGLFTDAFTFVVHNTSIPGASVDFIDVPWQGQIARYAGRRNYTHSLGFQCMEVEEGTVGRTLYSWAQLCSSHYDGMCQNRNNEYAMDIQLICLNENREAVNVYNLYNAWLQNVADVGMNQNQNGLVMYNCTLAYDYWEMGTGDTNTGLVLFEATGKGTQASPVGTKGTDRGDGQSTGTEVGKYLTGYNIINGSNANGGTASSTTGSALSNLQEELNNVNNVVDAFKDIWKDVTTGW